jgi:hypothetical protein
MGKNWAKVFAKDAHQWPATEVDAPPTVRSEKSTTIERHPDVATRRQLEEKALALMAATRDGPRPRNEFAIVGVAVFDDAASVLVEDRGEDDVAQVALERISGRWRTAGAATVGSTFQGADGDGFVVATSGPAPPDARRALIELGDQMWEAPVECGFFHFARRFPAGSLVEDPANWPRVTRFTSH